VFPSITKGTSVTELNECRATIRKLGDFRRHRTEARLPALDAVGKEVRNWRRVCT
jgi:hypothetical protein